MAVERRQGNTLQRVVRVDCVPSGLCTMVLHSRTINTLEMKWTVGDRKKFRVEMQLLCCMDLETLTLEFTLSATSALRTTAEPLGDSADR